MDLSFREQVLEDLKKDYSFLDVEKLTDEYGSPLLVVKKSKLIQRYEHLTNIMPSVRPHFAIKSCPNIEVLKIYKSISASLDVATIGEIKLLEAINYPPELLIHTHPHKKAEDIRYAYDYGIRTFTLDDLAEIDVLEPYKKYIDVVLRLSFPNEYSRINLSYKFGLDIKLAVGVAKTLLDGGYNLTGVSFHAGSQLDSVEPIKYALHQTLDFMKAVKAELNHSFTLLDIGGGFPAPYTHSVVDIEEFATVINSFIGDNMPNMKVISEPGRYLINPCVTLFSQVVSRTIRDQKDWLFIDDGVYATFSDMLSGHSSYILFGRSELNNEPADRSYVVAGPTCDSIDVISKAERLPETKKGDIILTPNIGAYSYALTSEFNSIPRTKLVVM